MKLILVFIIVSLMSPMLYAQWSVHTIDKKGSGADGIKLADINSDERIDIATGWEESGITKVYIQPELKDIKKEWPVVVIGKTPNVEDAVFTDMNNDGSLEVVSSTENGSQRIFIHFNFSKKYLESSEWSTQVLPASDGIMSWMYAEPLQIDKKYGVDLIAAGKGKNAAIGWFEAPLKANNLQDWKWHEISPVGWIMSIYLSDMDADGDKDIVITDRKGELAACRWIENPGVNDQQKHAWKNHYIGAEGLEVMFMCIADVDNNNVSEIVISERTQNTVRIYSKKGNGWNERIINLPKWTGVAKSVAVGDVDNDGFNDLIVSTNTMAKEKHGLIWLNGTKLCAAKDQDWESISGKHKAKYDKVELLDLDDDGDLDILICEENYGKGSKGLGVVWYENKLVK